MTAADTDRFFSFDSAAIGLAIATWSYRQEPTADGGTHLTEIWHDNRGWIMRRIAVIVSGIRDRATHSRESMKITLQKLKAHLESQPPGSQPAPHVDQRRASTGLTHIAQTSVRNLPTTAPK